MCAQFKIQFFFLSCNVWWKHKHKWCLSIKTGAHRWQAHNYCVCVPQKCVQNPTMDLVIAGLMMLSGWHIFLRRASFFACRLDKHLYVIGGRNETGYLSSVESYNLETNEWNYVSSLPQPLAAHAGAVHNGKIYISGQERGCRWATLIIASSFGKWYLMCCTACQMDTSTKTQPSKRHKKL